MTDLDNGLRQRFLQAAKWTLLGHMVSLLIRLGSTLILTRLLAPELYGLMAVGYVIMNGLHMFSDMGLHAGAIRSDRGDDPLFLNVGWMVQITRGFIITLVSAAAAAALKLSAHFGWLPVNSVYTDPDIPLLIAVISITALISGFESTKVWWVRRHLSLAGLTKIDVIRQLATTIFILIWAFISPTIWALAAGAIFSACLKTVLTHSMLPGPSNRFAWDARIFSEIIHFGKWVVLSSAFTFLLANGDRLLLGGMLDSKSMGLYTTALVLIGTVHGAVVSLVGSAVLPALSEVFRDKPTELREKMYRIRWPIDWVCLFSAGSLMTLGELIIKTLYDPRYAPAGWILSVLAVILVATRLNVFDQCLVAIGRVKLLSVLNAIRFVTLYCVVPAGYWMAGGRGAIIAVAGSTLVNAFAVLSVQHRLGYLEIRRELLAIPIFAGGLAFGWVTEALLKAIF